MSVYEVGYNLRHIVSRWFGFGLSLINNQICKRNTSVRTFRSAVSATTVINGVGYNGSGKSLLTSQMPQTQTVVNGMV